MDYMKIQVDVTPKEIADLELEVQGQQRQCCDDFYVIPNDETKKVAIVSPSNAVCLELSKEKAKALAAIIQDCVQLW